MNVFQQEFMSIPPVTRAYTTACVLTTLAVQLDLVTPFQLYFNPDLVFRKYQFWRLITSFLYFGTFGFNFVFNIIFTYRYCRMLEENNFRGKVAAFVYMFILGGAIMIVSLPTNYQLINCFVKFIFSQITACFVSLVFLGQAFTIMLVYVWSRRNPYIQMNFFGILNFKAPYLPWVLLIFSLLLGNPIVVDVMGIVVGHLYFYLEDILPNQSNGIRVLKTPRIL